MTRTWPGGRACRRRPRGRCPSRPRPAPVVGRQVIGVVRAGLDGAPPRLVPAVPLDGLAEAVPEPDRRRPAEAAQLRTVDRVAAVMSGTVGDVVDQLLVGIED